MKQPPYLWRWLTMMCGLFRVSSSHSSAMVMARLTVQRSFPVMAGHLGECYCSFYINILRNLRVKLGTYLCYLVPCLWLCKWVVLILNYLTDLKIEIFRFYGQVENWKFDCNLNWKPKYHIYLVVDLGKHFLVASCESCWHAWKFNPEFRLIILDWFALQFARLITIWNIIRYWKPKQYLPADRLIYLPVDRFGGNAHSSKSTCFWCQCQQCCVSGVLRTNFCFIA